MSAYALKTQQCQYKQCGVIYSIGSDYFVKSVVPTAREDNCSKTRWGGGGWGGREGGEGGGREVRGEGGREGGR